MYCKGLSTSLVINLGNAETVHGLLLGIFLSISVALAEKRVWKAMAGPVSNMANGTIIRRESRQTEVRKVKWDQQRWCCCFLSFQSIIPETDMICGRGELFPPHDVFIEGTGSC